MEGEASGMGGIFARVAMTPYASCATKSMLDRLCSIALPHYWKGYPKLWFDTYSRGAVESHKRS